ncbi:ABC transporter substrate-binding protein [Clostridiales bacterium FE2010]|nr:ABC transporter substrate-binding protein [Clostridiales bacterium FE2010]
MKHQIGKKLILWLAALTLLVTSCATAFASPGDRTLKHTSSISYDYSESFQFVYRNGDGFCVIGSDDSGRFLLKFADTESEPEKIYIEEYNRRFDDEEEEDAAAAEEQMTGETAEAAEPEAAEPAAEKAEEGKQESAEPETVEPAADAEAESEEAPAAEVETAAEGQPAVEGLLNWDDIDWSDEALNSEDMPEGFMDGEMYEYVPEPYINNWFGWNGELYGIGITDTWDDETQQSHIESIKLQRIRFENGEVIKEDTEFPEWDHEKLMAEAGYDGYFYLNDIVVAGDLLITQTWGMDGEKIIVIDLKTGSCSALDGGDYVVAITAGPEGSVLLANYDWTTEKTTLTKKSLTDGKEEPVAEFENGTQNMGICYEQDTDTLYMVMNGELWKAPLADAANAVAVNDCPLTDCDIVPMGNGFVLLWNSNNILIRNTDPAVRGTLALHVEDNTGYNQTMSETVFTLSEKRGDLSVIVRQQYDWRDSSTVLQDMMNKDSGTDIYVLPYDGTNFNALKNRGYLADLGDNAEIAEYVNRMYPYIQDALKVDGKIIGVPIGLTGNTFGFSYNVWKQIGGTEEELPKTWDQFLDWFEKLPERLEGTEISICDDPYAASSLPGMFMEAVMLQYQMLKESKGEELVFNTPEMKNLIERIYNMDFKSLGMKSWEDDDNNSYVVNNNESAIISSYTMAPMGQEYSNSGYPMALSLAENEEPIMPVQIYIACVNPFSEHAKEAKEFLALAMGNLETIAQYSFFADKTEPIRYSYYEEQMKNYEKWLNEAKKNYEKADEGEEKIYAEENVKMWEEEIKRFEDDSWLVSPEKIERFQKILPTCRVLDHNFTQEIQSTVSEEDERLMEEYTGDNMDVDKILSFYDQKLQMIRMEGK